MVENLGRSRLGVTRVLGELALVYVVELRASKTVSCVVESNSKSVPSGSVGGETADEVRK